MAISISKLTIAATSITGVTAVTATSAILAGGSGNSTTNPSLENQEPVQTQPIPIKKTFQKPTWTHKTIPELGYAKNVHERYEDIACIKDSFEEIEWTGGNTSSSNFDNIDKFTNNSNSTKSCIAVEYYKQTYTNGKWWGEFRLVWVLKDETTKQGLITVTEAKPHGRDLTGSSAAYFLKKEDNGENKWKVLHSKEKDEHKINNSADILTLIPEVGDALRFADEEESWGFNGSDTGICGLNDCETTMGEKKHKSYKWEMLDKSSEKGGLGTLHEWNKNLSTWLENNFGWGSLTSKIPSFYGKWIKKQTP